MRRRRFRPSAAPLNVRCAVSTRSRKSCNAATRSASPSASVRQTSGGQSQASISELAMDPWTEVFLHLGGARTALRNFVAMSPSSSRSRFFENAEWSQAAALTPMPTVQRNSRSYSSRSTKAAPSGSNRTPANP